jgi:hypothetical protein
MKMKKAEKLTNVSSPPAYRFVNKNENEICAAQGEDTPGTPLVFQYTYEKIVFLRLKV